jgi:hypothetical protein
MILAVRLGFVLIMAIVSYCIIRALRGRPRWFWVAAVLLYLLSVPFAMSIGGLIVAGALAAAGAATAASVGRDPAHAALGAAVGVVIWSAWATFGDITWIFYPALALVELILV